MEKPKLSARPASSALNGSDKLAPKIVAAAPQWYESNRRLYDAEIAAMKDFLPDSSQFSLGFQADTKRMFWRVAVSPTVAGRRTRKWTLLMVYDDDHPKVRYGGSVKVYPVLPNHADMMALVRNSRVTPKTIPHLLAGPGGFYMCTADTASIQADQRVTSAAQCLRFAMRWINVFELGLRDQRTWSLFQKHGRI
ncbi:MAG: hypothetical protein LBU32_26170 [Clostridiales bacterium]|nr:hypothetical protein [Clostridiales bacterium]